MKESPFSSDERQIYSHSSFHLFYNAPLKLFHLNLNIISCYNVPITFPMEERDLLQEFQCTVDAQGSIVIENTSIATLPQAVSH